jgi:methionine sulfoxide reductase heme-binding subunit
MPAYARPSAVPVAAAALVLSLLAIASAFILADTPADRALLAARYTARAGFAAFTLVFLAGPVAKLWPGRVSLWLVRRRRHLGLAMAFVMLVHLVAVAVNIGLYRPRSLAEVVPGGFVYALLLAMALTSTNAAQRGLGHGWRRLHMVGIVVLWITFAQSYVGRLFTPGDFWVGALFAPLVIGILLLRVAGILKRTAA